MKKESINRTFKRSIFSVMEIIIFILIYLVLILLLLKYI